MQDTMRRMCYSSVYGHEKDPSQICVEFVDDAIIAEFDGSMFEKKKAPQEQFSVLVVLGMLLSNLLEQRSQFNH